MSLTKCVGSKCALKFNCLRFLMPSGKFQAYGPFDALREDWQDCDFFEENNRGEEWKKANIVRIVDNDTGISVPTETSEE